MPSSKTKQITEAIKSKIAVSYAAGFSGLDMTNKVVIGTVIEPPYIPFACIAFTQSSSVFGQTMGRYRITASYDIYAFIGGGDVEERTLNAQDLASDIIGALTADRQLGISSVVDDIKCAFTTGS